MQLREAPREPIARRLNLSRAEARGMSAVWSVRWALALHASGSAGLAGLVRGAGRGVADSKRALRQGSHVRDRAPLREYLNILKACLFLLAPSALGHLMLDFKPYSLAAHVFAEWIPSCPTQNFQMARRPRSARRSSAWSNCCARSRPPKA
ncbi:hypothetical protein BCAR13_850003 [Paraburkholderia caribensis]|nr:hypothetical protein BCAR13_850003 [Paraburkholderia caribensis]